MHRFTICKTDLSVLFAESEQSIKTFVKRKKKENEKKKANSVGYKKKSEEIYQPKTCISF